MRWAVSMNHQHTESFNLKWLLEFVDSGSDISALKS